VEVTFGDGDYLLALPGGECRCAVERRDERPTDILIDGRRYAVTVIAIDGRLHCFMGGDHTILRCFDPLHTSDTADAVGDGLAAPMPGTVLEVFVESGQEVSAGTPLMLLEAMKIEHTIAAPFDGTVGEIHFKQGDQIAAEGVQLIVVEPRDN
jgi:3-methylcrotonyl-CoA carboxylase alpha subunit